MNSQAPRNGKKKLKKGWMSSGGKADSCQSDPYGDDNPSGKKRSKK